MLKRKDEKIEEQVTFEEPQPKENSNENVTENETITVESPVTGGINIDETVFEADTENIFKDLHQYKNAFLKAKKVTDIIRYVLLGVIFAGMIGAAVCVSKPDLVNTTGKIIIIVVALLFVISYFAMKILTNRYTQNKAKAYIDKYYEYTMKYILDKEGISMLTINPKGKVGANFLENSRFYNDIRNIGSRNVCSYTFNGKEYICSDAALEKVGAKNQLEPVFIGKFVKLTTDVEINGRLLIQVKGNSKLTNPINDLEDLELIDQRGNYTIYSNLKNAKSYVIQPLIDILAKFRLNNDLLDVIVSVSDGSIIVGLDYNDNVMKLPIKTEFNKGQIDEIKEHIDLSMQLCELFYRKIKK